MKILICSEITTNMVTSHFSLKSSTQANRFLKGRSLKTFENSKALIRNMGITIAHVLENLGEVQEQD
jgi:hypothetical protein